MGHFLISTMAIFKIFGGGGKLSDLGPQLPQQIEPWQAIIIDPLPIRRKCIIAILKVHAVLFLTAKLIRKLGFVDSQRKYLSSAGISRCNLVKYKCIATTIKLVKNIYHLILTVTCKFKKLQSLSHLYWKSPLKIAHDLPRVPPGKLLKSRQLLSP